MEIKTLKAEKRDPHGSRAVQRLRKAGRIPGIIYGHKQTPESIALDRHELEKQLELGAHLINVDMGGKAETCLIKDVQYDHLGMEPLHIDFARVDLTERVKVKVPLEMRGHAKGITAGGVITQQLMELEVECLVTAIPDSIRVNIADMELNQMLHVRELQLPNGVQALVDAEAIVVMCREPLVEVTPVAGEGVAAEGAAEPEVIAKGKLPVEGEEGAEGAAKEAPKKEEKKK